MRSAPVTAALMAISCVGYTHSLPKLDNNGFPNLLTNKDQLALESAVNETTALDKAGRFGFPTYTTDGQNVNNVVPGLYGPVKLDIGGLVLGTIVGLGAFFILPKIFSVISSPYGGYKRSEDEPSVGGSSVSEIYRQFSDSLEAMNLDEAACLQRLICSSVQSVPSSDGLLDAIATNEFVKTMLGGSDWDVAFKVGKNGKSCGLAFPKCPFTVDSVIKPLLKYFYSTKP